MRYSICLFEAGLLCLFSVHLCTCKFSKFFTAEKFHCVCMHVLFIYSAVVSHLNGLNNLVLVNGEPHGFLCLGGLASG